MPSDLLPFSPSESYAALKPRRWRAFLRSRATLKIVFFSTVFLFTGTIVYVTFFSPSWRFPVWHLPSRFDPDSIPDDPSFPSQSSPVSDVLTLEQIRDIVAPTRGFFSRDYSLSLGWKNVSVSLGIRYQLQMIS
jgi:hypothetical protein